MRSLLARLGLGAGTGLAKAATVPSCLMCAAYPVLAGPLAAAGLFGADLILHHLLVVLAPINLGLLALTYRFHRRPWGLVLGATGVALILSHMAFHYVPQHHPVMRALYPYDFQVGMALIWVGMVLLAIGVALDWRARRQPKVVLIR